MNKENNKLGMGLGALLNTNNKNKSSTNKIDISKIYPNKNQPRKSKTNKNIPQISIEEEKEDCQILIRYDPILDWLHMLVF